MNKIPQNATSIWSLSFGFLGLQVGFTLLATNTSRIFTGLGVEVESLPLFWLAGPIAGLLVQPIVGFLSDRTNTRLGKRIPYILLGSFISALLMLIHPKTLIPEGVSPAVGALFLIFLIMVAFNIAMQPFRALVGDHLSGSKGDIGFSVQSFFINIGTVIGGVLPFLLARIGVNNVPIDGELAHTIIWSFRIAACFIITTVLWTCIRVKDVEANTTENKPIIGSVMDESKTIRLFFQVGVVQFFSWFGAYYLWVYGIDAIAENVWNTKDPLSLAYNDAANWFGVITCVDPIVAAICTILLPMLMTRFGRKPIYSMALLLGSVGIGSMFFIQNQYLLLISMIGYGIGWAAILTFPFAILSSVIPKNKMGWYMGLINITIVIPQLLAGLIGKPLFNLLTGGSTAVMLLVSAIALLLAAISVFFIEEEVEIRL